MNPKTLSSRYQPDLGAELRSMVGDSPLGLYDVMRYHFGWVDVSGHPRPGNGGKLLRPGLCLLSCESVGGDWRQALPAAAALELLHNFTLIHDDIEDGDRERRGVPTVWHIWGQAQGINTGDAMHSLARLALLKLEDRWVAHAKVLRAARLLDQACLRLCEGQYLDISYEDRLDIGIEDYLQMIGAKTAALFECSLKLGALVGTDAEQTIEHMGEFGRNLGLAFQIQDDVIGIWGDDTKTGKSSASDIVKKKKTLPVVYGMQQGALAQKDALVDIYTHETISTSDISLVQDILNKVDARQYARERARHYCEKAIAELREIPIASSARADLESLARFTVERDY
ncbi:MAG: polyprenyl synthetase family protein [Chloroflexota bacterium]|nr:polyprenyl synthetase family protein [Chloroflexota bacterium]